MEKINIFATQYLRRQIFTVDNSQLEQNILHHQSENPGRKISNYGGWQSRNINFNSFSNEVTLLSDEILATSRALATSYRVSAKLIIGNLWFNVNGTGAFNAPHRHPNSLFSAVYYVNVPKGSGNIVFKNPNPVMYAHLTTDNLIAMNDINATNWTVIPEPGMILVFPSWLEHYVEPNSSQENRISISYNICAESTVHQFFAAFQNGDVA